MRCPRHAHGLSIVSPLAPWQPICWPTPVTAACGLFPIAVPCLFGDVGPEGSSEVIVW